MIEITLSRELAADHPRFVVGCAERGHRIEVFGTSDERPESDASETRDPDDVLDAGDIGRPGPGRVELAGPNGPACVN